MTEAQLLKDIEESLKIFQEIKELSKNIRDWNISYSPAGFFGVNKVEMVSKNLKATYPQLSVSTSLAYNLAKDNDMLELIEDEI